MLEVKHLNRELDDLKAALEGAVVSQEEQKLLMKAREAEERRSAKPTPKRQRRLTKRPRNRKNSKSRLKKPLGLLGTWRIKTAQNRRPKTQVMNRVKFMC